MLRPGWQRKCCLCTLCMQKNRMEVKGVGSALGPNQLKVNNNYICMLENVLSCLNMCR